MKKAVSSTEQYHKCQVGSFITVQSAHMTVAVYVILVCVVISKHQIFSSCCMECCQTNGVGLRFCWNDII